MSLAIDRENRVKILKNVGQCLIDEAENIIGPDNIARGPIRQEIRIVCDIDNEIPIIEVNTGYKLDKALSGVRWRNV